MAGALPQCYHGPISKADCEELLGKKNKDGAYLLRDSETIQGAMCLCVYKQRVVYTYRVLQTHNGNYTLLTAGDVQETYFKSLEDLIRNYKRRNQGLAIHLRHAVKRKTDMLIWSRRTSESSARSQAGVSARAPATLPAGVSARAPATLPAGVSARLSGGVPVGHASLRDNNPLPEEGSVYENDTSSDYVEVLPDQL